MVIAALTLMFIVVVLVSVQAYAKRAKQRAKLQKKEEGQVPELYRMLQPLIKYLAGINRLIPLPGIREKYTRDLDRAGLQIEMTADEFISLKIVLVIIGTVFGLITYAVVIQNWVIVFAIVFLSFVFPDLRLTAAVRSQEEAYLRALPGFLDLLALAVEAGLGFDSAVRRLTETLEPNAMTRGFQTFLRNMNVGKPRVEALREMARKLDLPDFTTFAQAVVQATESGAAIGPVLKIQSTEMTLRRFERAEKKAHELPVKMLLPLTTCIFPATFLMILGPMYFQVVASGVAGTL